MTYILHIAAITLRPRPRAVGGKIEMTKFVTFGDVRGYGPVRNTREAAERDLAKDRAGCRAHGGYSDRAVYEVDADGWLRTDSGDHVWPSSGRTNGAEGLRSSESVYPVA